MANRLKVFVSSTMDDLVNERRAVVRSLQELGIEAVHAETIAPTGGTSWEVIEERIGECHIFLLILGERYGWAPPPKSGTPAGKSVTHLEFDLAKRLKLPIIPFLKRLAYGAERAGRRDDFRREVSDWDTGHFRQEFDFADELGEKVTQAFVSLFTDSLLKQLVRHRDENMSSPVPTISTDPRDPSSKWILIAGAGLSIAAGYPTAAALMSAMTQKLWPEESGATAAIRYSFSELAAVYQKKLGRESLVGVIKELLNTAQKIAPTGAHLYAVKKFKTIITTNFDELFELACITQRIPYQVITPFTQNFVEHRDGVSIFKISGSISDPTSLQLTSADLVAATSNQQVFSFLLHKCRTKPLAVVGHGLRDLHVQQLLAGPEHTHERLYVNPGVGPFEEPLLEQFQLKGIKETADDFLKAFNPR